MKDDLHNLKNRYIVLGTKETREDIYPIWNVLGDGTEFWADDIQDAIQQALPDPGYYVKVLVINTSTFSDTTTYFRLMSNPHWVRY